MKKNNIRFYLILGIVLFLFSLISFVAPFQKNVIFICAYIFTLLSIIVQIYIFKITLKTEDTKSRIYGVPVAKIGIFYLVIQLIVSLSEMVLAPMIPIWCAIIINIVILSLFAIGIITTDIVKKEAIRQDKKLKDNTRNLKKMKVISTTLLNKCNNPDVKKALQQLNDAIKYSDPVSCEATEELEIEIIDMLENLKNVVLNGENTVISNQVNQILDKIIERNTINKISK